MSEERPPVTTPAEPEDHAVVVGSSVRVRDSEGEDEHTIVGRVTAAAPKRCISAASPVGRALLGRRAGEKVRVQTPGGVRLLTIVEVTDARVPSPPPPYEA